MGDEVEISDNRKHRLKKRTTIDAKPIMKHPLERWILIETKHFLNVI